ncbi:hypothetical protein FRC14_003196 [Serendipita sp. 396]|nr:hypothetical protein FRC14_003196 [Serendipita sp. 396]KAG8783777.1 hypothetical protein FRC15_004570 [Serendipita sp. 397]
MRPPNSFFPALPFIFSSPLSCITTALLLFLAAGVPVSVDAQETQDNANTYSLVNDTSSWVALPASSWTLNTTLGSYYSAWLIGHQASDGTPTTATVTFNGTDVWIFGTVVNGIQNRSLNYTVKVDNNETITEPVYIPTGLANGMDLSWTLFSQRSLPMGSHVITLTLIGESSPFLIQGALSRNTVAPSASSTTPITSPTSSPASSGSASDDSAKLGGAIGGGVGALIIVALIIFFMIRRIRRMEAKEKKVMARPFVTSQRPPGAASISDRSNAHGLGPGTTPSSQRSRTLFPGSVPSEKEREKEKLVQQSSAPSAPSSSKSRSRTYSSSKSHSRNASQSQSQSQTHSHVHSHYTQQLVQVPSVPRQQQQDVLDSPQGSLISLPSEYQAATTVIGGGRGPGTAVASSYIGTSPPPPDEDAPPVPALPKKAEMGRKKIKNKQDNIPTDLPPPFESIHPQTMEYPPDFKRDPFRSSHSTTNLVEQKRTPDSTYFSSPFTRSNSIPISGNSGIGLFSTDSVNTIGSTGSSRPLPTVPGTRNAAPTYSFPPEKVGLSPPPPAHQQRARSNSTKKRPLPQPDPPTR